MQSLCTYLIHWKHKWGFQWFPNQLLNEAGNQLKAQFIKDFCRPMAMTILIQPTDGKWIDNPNKYIKLLLSVNFHRPSIPHIMNMSSLSPTVVHKLTLQTNTRKRKLFSESSFSPFPFNQSLMLMRTIKTFVHSTCCKKRPPRSCVSLRLNIKVFNLLFCSVRRMSSSYPSTLRFQRFNVFQVYLFL